MLLDGSAPKEIAYSLNISYETVLYHQKKIYRKLDIHSINELFLKYSPVHSESLPKKTPPKPLAGEDPFAQDNPPKNAAKNLLKKNIKTPVKKKKSLRKTAVYIAVILFIIFAFLYIHNLKGEIIVPNPIIITFTDDGPPGTDGQRGWQYIIDRDLFFYNGEWRKSPYRQKRERVTAGDTYDISCTFISDTDIGYLEAGFFDSLAGGKEGYYWTTLSGNQKLLKNIKAGIKYNVSLSLAITETATCDADISNRFYLAAGPKTENNPTLTFSQFDITKH